MSKLFPPHPPYMGMPSVPPQSIPAQAMSRFLPAGINPGMAAPSIFPSTAAQSGGLTTLLPSIQKMIGVAQTVTPMIRQYYPLVKQLPALWSMLSSSPPSSDASNSTTSEEQSTDSFNDSADSNNLQIDDANDTDNAYFSETPPPKLYI
ncbi:VrrA/YqfQ family protein [Alteribacillus sp. JSM 102045]|uniref:VrrA/YqfQ family protein n=1 Tax=Alteribacillus sp. JSM 102045 TaxID=1562101 RepID=UPI0035C1F568